MAVLKPSLLALSLVLPAVSSQAGDCTADQSAKPTAATAGHIVYNPWLDLMRMQAAFERSFDGMVNPFWMPVTYVPSTAFMLPAMERSSLKRTDDGYQLQFNLPGYKAEDIHVRLDGQLLTVSAQSSGKDTIKVGQQDEQTLSRSSYAETLILPGTVQSSGLKEQFKDGVLTITIPSSKGSGGAA